MSGQKHLRLRYYTSLEEARLMRLWREHLTDICSYTQNLPIFREISHSLQQNGIRLNKQEVRRRINSYRNKYLNEKNRLQCNPEYKSEWRLYSLIDCLYYPTVPAGDLHLADNVLEAAVFRAREDLPALPHMLHTSTNQLKFERDSDGSAFLEALPTEHVLKTECPENACDHNTTEDKPSAAILIIAAASYSTKAEDGTIKRAPLTNANHQLLEVDAHQPAANVNGQPEGCFLAKKRRGRRSLMPHSGQITMALVEAIRKENQMLEEQNDANMLALEQKDKQFLTMELNLLAHLNRQESLLVHLEQYGIKQEPFNEF
ncbi:hypothetical protein KR009_001001 [Drosophila setifemur]|nr:hypothetical protein KR009_001001 [Drosophila setifemur]